jgi:hypothetical protein
MGVVINSWNKKKNLLLSKDRDRAIYLIITVSCPFPQHEKEKKQNHNTHPLLATSCLRQSWWKEMEPLASEEKTRKPQSLKSLANYKNKYQNQLPPPQDPIEERTLPPVFLEPSLEQFETELENSQVTFIDLNSDLSEIFKNIQGSQLYFEEDGILREKEEEPLESDQTHHLNTIEEFQKHDPDLIHHLQIMIQQLQIENTELKTPKEDHQTEQLSSEIMKLHNQVSNLQYDLKERDEQVPSPSSLFVTHSLTHSPFFTDQKSRTKSWNVI